MAVVFAEVGGDGGAPFGPLVVLSELGLKLGPLGRELGEMLFEVQTVTLINLDLCLDLLYLDLHGIDHTRDARGGAVEHLERMRGNVPLQLLPVIRIGRHLA